MITFGLTGGIACGKSTVTKTFRANKIPIVDADIVARQVVEPGKPGLEALVSAFGKQMLMDDGTLDRAKLATLVFNNPNLSIRNDGMALLNSIMAPLIQKESSRQLAELHEAGNKVVGYDGALIIEMGNADKYRPLIVVSCPQDMQIQRLMSRNSLTLSEAMDRINAQMPVAEKVKMADHVIDTSGTIEESILQTEKVLHRIHLLMYKMMLESGEITYRQVPWPWRDTDGNTWNDDD